MKITDINHKTTNQQINLLSEKLINDWGDTVEHPAYYIIHFVLTRLRQQYQQIENTKRSEEVELQKLRYKQKPRPGSYKYHMD